jgi:hypothetical protein
LDLFQVFFLFWWLLVLEIIHGGAHRGLSPPAKQKSRHITSTVSVWLKIQQTKDKMIMINNQITCISI